MNDLCAPATSAETRPTITDESFYELLYRCIAGACTELKPRLNHYEFSELIPNIYLVIGTNNIHQVYQDLSLSEAEIYDDVKDRVRAYLKNDPFVRRDPVMDFVETFGPGAIHKIIREDSEVGRINSPYYSTEYTLYFSKKVGPTDEISMAFARQKLIDSNEYPQLINTELHRLTPERIRDLYIRILDTVESPLTLRQLSSLMVNLQGLVPAHLPSAWHNCQEVSTTSRSPFPLKYDMEILKFIGVFQRSFPDFSTHSIYQVLRYALIDPEAVMRRQTSLATGLSETTIRLAHTLAQVALRKTFSVVTEETTQKFMSELNTFVESKLHDLAPKNYSLTRSEFVTWFKAGHEPSGCFAEKTKDEHAAAKEWTNKFLNSLYLKTLNPKIFLATLGRLNLSLENNDLTYGGLTGPTYRAMLNPTFQTISEAKLTRDILRDRIADLLSQDGITSFYDEARFTKLESQCDAIVTTDPTFSTSWGWWGRSEWKQDKFDIARETFSKLDLTEKIMEVLGKREFKFSFNNSDDRNVTSPQEVTTILNDLLREFDSPLPRTVVLRSLANYLYTSNLLVDQTDIPTQVPEKVSKFIDQLTRLASSDTRQQNRLFSVLWLGHLNPQGLQNNEQLAAQHSVTKRTIEETCSKIDQALKTISFSSGNEFEFFKAGLQDWLIATGQVPNSSLPIIKIPPTAVTIRVTERSEHTILPSLFYGAKGKIVDTIYAKLGKPTSASAELKEFEVNGNKWNYCRSSALGPIINGKDSWVFIVNVEDDVSAFQKDLAEYCGLVPNTQELVGSPRANEVILSGRMVSKFFRMYPESSKKLHQGIPSVKHWQENAALSFTTDFKYEGEDRQCRFNRRINWDKTQGKENSLYWAVDIGQLYQYARSLNLPIKPEFLQTLNAHTRTRDSKIPTTNIRF